MVSAEKGQDSARLENAEDIRSPSAEEREYGTYTYVTARTLQCDLPILRLL